MFEYIHHVAYAVDDMDDAVSVFRDIFELEPVDRRTVDGEPSFEMATFRCGPTLIELQRPINYPQLSAYLEDHGPGLTHVAFATRDLTKRIEALKDKGVFMKPPGAFIAGTGWKIANFDTTQSGLDLFESKYHDDHLADAGDAQ